MITFNASAHDGDWVTVGSTSLVVAKSGLYIVRGSVRRAGASTSLAFHVHLLLNDVAIDSDDAAASTAAIAGKVGCMRELVTNDTLAIDENAVGTSNVTALGTYLEAVRVGPVRWT